MNIDRYARQMALPIIGTEGQRKLANSTVLIVGLGGLGCPVSLYLAGAGIGHFILSDPDRVSTSNLHRQLLYTPGQEGLLKVEAATTRLKAIAPDATFQLVPEGIDRLNIHALVSQCDLVIDCCDNYATRYLIDDTCAELGKPWVFGAISGLNGMASVFNCGSPARYQTLFPDRDLLEHEPAASGAVMGPTPGVIGSVQAAEAIKILAGAAPALSGKLLVFNLETMESNILEIGNE